MDTRHITSEYIQTINDVINVGSVCSIGWNPQHNPFNGNNRYQHNVNATHDIDRIAVESYMILQQHGVFMGAHWAHAPLTKNIFVTIGKNRKIWFDPLCVSTSGQRIFAPLNTPLFLKWSRLWVERKKYLHDYLTLLRRTGTFLPARIDLRTDPDSAASPRPSRLACTQQTHCGMHASIISHTQMIMRAGSLVYVRVESGHDRAGEENMRIYRSLPAVLKWRST